MPIWLAGALLGLCAACRPAWAAQERFLLDSVNTHPAFDVTSLGFLHTHGVFSGASGEMTVDPQTRLGSIEVVIPTGSLTTGSPRRDAFIKGKEFFDVLNYPNAKVNASGIRLDGEFPMRIDGSLTLVGVTRPISLLISSLRCEVPGADQTTQCRGQVSTTIRRSDWGMKRYRFVIGEEVSIEVDVQASSQ